MSSTGNVFPGTGENNAGIGATAWTNPGSVTADDGTDATCSGASSQYLVARNYGFAVPSDATINGITVRVEASEHSASTETLNARLQNDAGVLVGSNKTATLNGTSKAVYTYGGTADLWGATLTPARVNDADFGVRLWFTTSHDVRIDYVTLAVEYTQGTAALTTSASTGSAGTAVPSSDKAATGSASTGSAGTVVQSLAVLLVGAAVAVGQGDLVRQRGLGFLAEQGSVTPTQALAGSESTVGQGDVAVDSDGVDESLSGDSSTATIGDTAAGAFVRLFSRKVGGGSATQPISGSFTTSAAGLFTPIPSKTPTGQVAALFQGAMVRSQAAPLSGSAIAAQATALTYEGVDNWLQRSTASGVVMADRLDGTLTPSNDGNIVGAFVLNDVKVGNVSRDTSEKRGTATASTKFAILNGDGANSGNVGMNFSSVTTIGDGDVVWGSYQIKAPAAMCYQPWPVSTGETGQKMSILSHHASSSVANEFVVQLNYNANTISAYAQNGLGGFVAYDTPAVTNCSGTDFKWQGSIDRGASPLTGTDPETGISWSACAQDRARYGGLYSAKSLSQYQVGLGDPLSGAFRLYPSEWITVTFRVARGVSGSSNSRYTVWAERQSVAGYTKLIDASSVLLGSYSNYDNLWLLPYVTNRVSGGTKVSSRTGLTGVTILATGLGCPTGAGSLEYVASTGLFRWKGNGESYGTARGFSATNNILRINVTSSGTSYLTIEVNPALLPSSGTTVDTVTIATGRNDTQVNYQDAIVSKLPILSPGGAIPTGISTLGDLAAGMTAGTWAQLTVSNQNTILADTGSSGSSIHFSNSFPWNPISRCIEMVCSDHMGAPTASWQRHLRYNDSSNTFSQAEARGAASGIGHGYDHNSVNPYTGDLYFRPYNQENIYRKSLGGSSFSNVTAFDDHGFAQVAIGSCWWKGSFTGGGAQGSLVIFNSGNAVGASTDGQITAYNPLTNSWFFDQSSMAPNYGSGSTYHSVIEYSDGLNVAVFGGGNAAPNKIWRLNSNGTSTALTNVPTASGMGIQKGIICADPVTGRFLLLSSSQLWELNPTGSGTWTQQTGTRTPPSAIGSPDLLDGVVCCPIPDYGVIAYIKQTSSTGGTFYLYKHA